jgi:pimeloyl-ACP methyl ester carboxylesterase
MTADEPRTPESLLLAPAEGREERAGLDGWDAHILRWGATSSRRVLLVHGFTSRAHSWPHLAGPEAAPEGGARIRANIGRPDVFASIDDALADARVWFPGADEGLLRHRVQHNLVPTADGELTWRTAPELRDGTAPPDDFTADERWAAWRTVSAPTLLAHGADSDVETCPLVQDLRNARPDIEVVDSEGAGHAIPLDQPGPLAAAVGRFLTSPERS